MSSDELVLDWAYRINCDTLPQLCCVRDYAHLQVNLFGLLTALTVTVCPNCVVTAKGNW